MNENELTVIIITLNILVKLNTKFFGTSIVEDKIDDFN